MMTCAVRVSPESDDYAHCTDQGCVRVVLARAAGGHFTVFSLCSLSEPPPRSTVCRRPPGTPRRCELKRFVTFVQCLRGG
ncbi:hypothetical protein AOLI_G00117140 [Acnodon oligacanthus]